MAEKVDKKKVNRERAHPITFFVSDEEFQNIRAHCYTKNIKHSQFIREAITEKLRREGSHKRAA